MRGEKRAGTGRGGLAGCLLSVSTGGLSSEVGACREGGGSQPARKPGGPMGAPAAAPEAQRGPGAEHGAVPGLHHRCPSHTRSCPSLSSGLPPFFLFSSIPLRLCPASPCAPFQHKNPLFKKNHYY